MIVKTKRYKSEFTTVPNDPINDRELSYEALGVWLYLMSKPDDWTVRMADLRDRNKKNGKKYGRDIMQGVFKELQEYGLAELKTIRDEKGNVRGRSWVISDSKPEDRKNRQSGKPKAGKTDSREIRPYSNKESLQIKNINNKEREKERIDPSHQEMSLKKVIPDFDPESFIYQSIKATSRAQKERWAMNYRLDATRFYEEAKSYAKWQSTKTITEYGWDHGCERIRNMKPQGIRVAFESRFLTKIKEIA